MLLLSIIILAFGFSAVSADDATPTAAPPPPSYDLATVIGTGEPFKGSIQQNGLTLTADPSDPTNLLVTGGMFNNTALSFGTEPVMDVGIASQNQIYVAHRHDIALYSTDGGLKLLKANALNADGTSVLSAKVTIYAKTAQCLLAFVDGVDTPTAITIVGQTGLGDNVAIHSAEGCSVSKQHQLAFIKFLAVQQGIYIPMLTDSDKYDATEILHVTPAYIGEVTSNGVTLKSSETDGNLLWSAGMTVDAKLVVGSRVLNVKVEDAAKHGYVVAQNGLFSFSFDGTIGPIKANGLSDGTTIYRLSDAETDCVIAFSGGASLPSAFQIQWGSGQYVLANYSGCPQPTVADQVAHLKLMLAANGSTVADMAS